jgi:hypothetical protein
VIRVYHGGVLDQSSGWLWATPDSAYAAAFAQLYEGALWMLTLDVNQDEVLDLTGCGLDVAAVATDLSFAGIPTSAQAGDERNPHRLLRRVPVTSIRKAGYRVVRIREWVDWGAGERHAESVLIADLTAIIDHEVLSLPDRNFQLDGRGAAPRGAELVCPNCDETRGDVVTVSENRVTFRCDGCGHRWSAEEPGMPKQ